MLQPNAPRVRSVEDTSESRRFDYIRRRPAGGYIVTNQSSARTPNKTPPNLGFSRLVSLDDAEASAIEVYGKSASAMIAQCALAAQDDGRDEDYQFWLALFNRLLGNPEADATLSA